MKQISELRLQELLKSAHLSSVAKMIVDNTTDCRCEELEKQNKVLVESDKKGWEAVTRSQKRLSELVEANETLTICYAHCARLLSSDALTLPQNVIDAIGKLKSLPPAEGKEIYCMADGCFVKVDGTNELYCKKHLIKED